MRDLQTNQRRDRSPNSQASSSRTTEDHLESLYLQHSRLMGVLQAPKANMSTFDGDPMGCFPFKRAFEENVEKLLDDEWSQLARLMQLCTGKAARAIQCCSMLPPAQGYRKAPQLLKAIQDLETRSQSRSSGSTCWSREAHAQICRSTLMTCRIATNAWQPWEPQGSCSRSLDWQPWSESCLPPCRIDGGTWSMSSRRRRDGAPSSRTLSSSLDEWQPWLLIWYMEQLTWRPAAKTKNPSRSFYVLCRPRRCGLPSVWERGAGGIRLPLVPQEIPRRLPASSHQSKIVLHMPTHGAHHKGVYFILFLTVLNLSSVQSMKLVIILLTSSRNELSFLHVLD